MVNTRLLMTSLKDWPLRDRFLAALTEQATGGLGRLTDNQVLGAMSAAAAYWAASYAQTYLVGWVDQRALHRAQAGQRVCLIDPALADRFAEQTARIDKARQELAQAAAQQMGELAYYSGYVGSSNIPAIQLIVAKLPATLELVIRARRAATSPLRPRR